MCSGDNDCDKRAANDYFALTSFNCWLMIILKYVYQAVLHWMFRILAKHMASYSIIKHSHSFKKQYYDSLVCLD